MVITNNIKLNEIKDLNYYLKKIKELKNNKDLNNIKEYFKNVLIYKVIDITFIITLYFLSAFYVAFFLDKLNNYIFDNKKNYKKSNNRLLFEIIITISITGITTFIFRNIIIYLIKNNQFTIGKLLYMIFNNDNIYDVSKVKEVEMYCNVIFMSFSLSFQSNLMKKLSILKENISK